MVDFIRVVDVETTGVGDQDKVVEVASIDVSLTALHPAFPMRDFVNPGIPIPPQASAIHHIVDLDVEYKPKLEEVIGKYKGAELYAAHNAKFDSRFLGDDLEGEWICTYKCAYAQWPDAPGYGNQVLRYWLELPAPPHDYGHAHRALYDCWVTGHLLIKLLEAGWTVDRLIEVSRLPRELRAIPFGKHRGTAFADLDIGYLDWMSTKSDWDEDVQYTLKKELERRRG